MGVPTAVPICASMKRVSLVVSDTLYDALAQQAKASGVRVTTHAIAALLIATAPPVRHKPPAPMTWPAALSSRLATVPQGEALFMPDLLEQSGAEHTRTNARAAGIILRAAGFRTLSVKTSEGVVQGWRRK